MKIGILFRLGSFWVGAHWSRRNRRLCVNPVPCVTIWVALKGGTPPEPSRPVHASQAEADRAYAQQVLQILNAAGRDGCLDEDVLFLASVWRAQADLDAAKKTCPDCGAAYATLHNDGCPKLNGLSAPRAGGGSVPGGRNPLRVLNDALHEYRTQHTNMSKDEFREHGCYDAFMWAWQNAQDDLDSARKARPS